MRSPNKLETVDPDCISLTLEIEIDSNLDSNERNTDSDLTESKAKVIAILHKDCSVSATQVSEETGLSVSTVNRAYESLKSKNYITREGRTHGKWLILK